jgi:hypothetical protein
MATIVVNITWVCSRRSPRLDSLRSFSSPLIPRHRLSRLWLRHRRSRISGKALTTGHELEALRETTPSLLGHSDDTHQDPTRLDSGLTCNSARRRPTDPNGYSRQAAPAFVRSPTGGPLLIMITRLKNGKLNYTDESRHVPALDQPINL